MKIGVLQGRLSKSVNGKMQEFPLITWVDEFNLISDIGLYGIEWLITNECNLNNPFFTEAILPKNIMSVCVDTMVNKSFYNQDFINKNLIPVLDRMSVLNVNKVVIPLLEDSSVDDPLIREEFLKNIIPIGEKYSFIEFCFEFESNKEIVLDVVSKKSNFFITYDTGNFTSHYKQKINHEDLILSFGDKIKNVHIKDRTYNSISKKFSFGDTDFMTIFKTLKKINYSDNFILQLCRDSEGDEKKYIEETYKKIKINYTF